MRRPSPRTAEQPAAFRAGEAVAGGALTYAAFIVISALWYTLVYGLEGQLGQQYGLAVAFAEWLYGGITAIVVVPIGTLIAALVGRALRRRASLPLHLVVHGALGYVVGAVATLLFVLLLSGTWTVEQPLLHGGPAAAFAVLVGWRSEVAIARRRDAKAAALAAA